MIDLEDVEYVPAMRAEVLVELEAILRPPPDLQGICSDHPEPELWWTGRGPGRREAIRICNNCPAQERCREYGEGETYGIWGGVFRTLETDRDQTPCKRGHTNWKKRPDGTVQCRECDRESKRASRARKTQERITA